VRNDPGENDPYAEQEGERRKGKKIGIRIIGLSGAEKNNPDRGPKLEGESVKQNQTSAFSSMRLGKGVACKLKGKITESTLHERGGKRYIGTAAVGMIRFRLRNQHTTNRNQEKKKKRKKKTHTNNRPTNTNTHPTPPPHHHQKTPHKKKKTKKNTNKPNKKNNKETNRIETGALVSGAFPALGE